jgi:methionyl-tRNA formyltransferase
MSEIKKVLFLGSKRMGLKCLMKIYSLCPDYLKGAITIDDKNDSRCVLNKFQEFCLNAGIPLNVSNNQKDAEDFIMKLQPDLCIVVGWYWLFSNEIIDTISHGFLGIHNSLLPSYRGGSPLNWAIINGEKKIGISLFSIENEMDSGDIWVQESVELKFNDYIGDILYRLEKKAVALFDKHYIGIISQNIQPIPQDHIKATFCAQRYPEDGFIQWEKSSADIYNFIRAQSSPYPGAFTYYNGNKLIIWEATPKKMTFFGTPGQVARISDNGVYVICGDNKPIVLKTIDLGSGKMPATKSIKSLRIRFRSQV